jgi:hypothetical protein
VSKPDARVGEAMFLMRLVSVILLGFGALITITRLNDSDPRLDLALLGSVCILCGSLLYAAEPILVYWILEGVEDKKKSK